MGVLPVTKFLWRQTVLFKLEPLSGQYNGRLPVDKVVWLLVLSWSAMNAFVISVTFKSTLKMIYMPNLTLLGTV